MSKKRVLFLSAGNRDARETHACGLSQTYECIYDKFFDLAFNQLWTEQQEWSDECSVQDLINQRLADYQACPFDAVLSTGDYPGHLFASIIAHQKGLPGPHPASIIQCQNKYLARCVQQRCVPHATPEFCLINPDDFDPDSCQLAFPVFIKPVKSFMSAWAQSVDSLSMLKKILPHSLPPRPFLQPLDELVRAYLRVDVSSCRLLAETVLEGVQVTLEGYVYDGQVYILGIVDSIMHENKISFLRFEYPSSLPPDIQERMADIARRCVDGFGLNMTIFNIEFMYNADHNTVHIIEINARMSSQFADLYEKVDGMNAYMIATDLALGNKPQMPYRRGAHAVAASCVLRCADDQLVVDVPGREHFDAVYEQYPDARIEIWARPGHKLSDDIQDGHMFRYGVINLGANSWQELHERFVRCQELLPFTFGSNTDLL